MIRNLKTLGVALAAVFVLSAMFASAASAQQAFLTGDGPLVSLKGTQIGAASVNRLTMLGTFTHCEGFYTGSTEGGDTEHASTFNLWPIYSSCQSTALNIQTHVNMQACYYMFHLEETTFTPADTYGVRTTLQCEGGVDPTVTITSPVGSCTITITPNPFEGYAGLDAVDTTNGEIDLKGTATGLSVDSTGTGCPEVGKNKPASLDLEVTVQGKNSTGDTTDIGISELGETTSHI